METENEKTIRIETVLKVIAKRWFLILLIGALCAALAFGYSRFFKAQQYSSKVSAVVYNTNLENKTSVSSSDQSASSNMINTIVKVLTQDAYVTQASEKLNAMLEEGTPAVSKGKIKSMVSATNDGAMLMTVRADSDYKNLAQAVAKAYEECLPGIVNDLFPSSVVRITTPATSASAIDKKVPMYTLLGFVIGAVAVFGIALVIELLDNTIKSEEDFKTFFPIPVLGAIPDIESCTSQKKGGYGQYGQYANAGTKN